MDYKDLGARVRTARKQHMMTQEQLAEAMGISASFLGHIERGSRVASLETLVSICNTLKVSPSHLLYGSLTLGQQYMPEDLSEKDRSRLREFLRLAEDTVSHWDE